MNKAEQNKLTEPDKAVDFLKNVADHKLVVLDFDETLFLRNSTEEYLNCLRPRAAGAIWLLILEILQPWQWLPGKLKGRESKDWVRVISATLLFPWTWFLWRIKAKQLATEHENQQLTDAMADHPEDKTVVATHGFTFVVKPLVRHMSVAAAKVIGCRFLRGLLDRQKGKEEILQSAAEVGSITEAVVVTDSLDDASLLRMVDHPLLVQWPKSLYKPALSDAYFPFFYLEFVKRPGQRYTRWVIAETHLVILILAYSWLSPMPPVHIAGVVALLISFWTIYETGYYENDRVAEIYEKKPALSETYHQLKSRMSLYQPWLIAAVAGFTGVLLIQTADLLSWELAGSWKRVSEQFSLYDGLTVFTVWIIALAAVRLLFAAYNYTNEATRVWIFPLLQTVKYLVFLTVATTNIIGMALLMSQVFVDWLPYLVYRCEGRRELVQEEFVRLFIFSLTTFLVLLSLGDWSPLFTWQFGFILLWVLIRGNDQLTCLFKNIHWIGRRQ